jgi:hypothetical protein
MLQTTVYIIHGLSIKKNRRRVDDKSPGHLGKTRPELECVSINL